MANPSIEHITAASAASLETLQSAINLTLNSFEKLASHQLSSTRNVLLEQLDGVRNLLGTKTPQEAFSLNGAYFQPQVEQAIAYYRGLHDISANTQEEYVKLLEQGHAELNKSAGNSELAVTAVKSAISAANSAFENANKAARQVADITEASVSAASKATSRAVEAVNSSTRRKAA